MSCSVVILAAGQGTRMHSSCAKVLHEIAGRPMLYHVIASAAALAPHEIIVVVHPSFDIEAFESPSPVKWVYQTERLGTGHALQQALPSLDPSVSRVLLLCGDVPLIQTKTLMLLLSTPEGGVAFLSTVLADPTGFGRVIRNENQTLLKIIEEKDATLIEKKINEINGGIYVFPRAKLPDWLLKLQPNNAQNELYVTELIRFAREEGIAVEAIAVEPEEVLGVNDRIQLEQAERVYQKRMVNHFCKTGVTVKDHARVDIRGNVKLARDVTLDINVILEGEVEIGSGCEIGAGVVIKNSQLAPGVKVLPYSIIEGATIASKCTIGPFARIRPNTVLAENVKIGNFVEVKKTHLNHGSKINHLSYIGDATVGANVNVGAGTITCNYDGKNKHKTIIEEGAFIGSNVELIAPLTVGKGAIVGAGTTLTKDAPANSVTVRRAVQKSFPISEKSKD